MPGESIATVPSRPWKAAIGWLLFLGPFFFATYGFANWTASTRADVGAIVFDWEHYIPFTAWTIVPYWSIDFLYGLSLLICSTRTKLFVHAWRLVTAQLISVTFFLTIPLRFTFDRPQVDGLYGWMFDILGGFDKPFNQAPSLHIALLVILWVLYAKYIEGAARWLLHGWFALIGISVLTTFQHHFVDLPTGFWVGWLCVWLLPDEGPSLLRTATLERDPRRLSLAVRYATAATAVAALSIYLGGWALWLLWVSGSLLLVAANYAFFGAAGFQKREDGSMSGAAKWLLAPYFAGAWVNSRWWTRSCAKANVIVPGVLIGRLPTGSERKSIGVRAIVDMAAELPCDSGDLRYASVPMLDLVAPSPRQLALAAEAIEQAKVEQPVLICCALGFSRSATATAAWLLASGRAAGSRDAIEMIRRARPGIVLNDAHALALDRFAASIAPRRVRHEPTG